MTSFLSFSCSSLVRGALQSRSQRPSVGKFLSLPLSSGCLATVKPPFPSRKTICDLPLTRYALYCCQCHCLCHVSSRSLASYIFSLPFWFILLMLSSLQASLVLFPCRCYDHQVPAPSFAYTFLLQPFSRLLWTLLEEFFTREVLTTMRSTRCLMQP